jgi:nickel transport protein
MNRRLNLYTSLLFVFFVTGIAVRAEAHSINYLVEQKGMAIRAYYSANDPAAYSQYELYGPGDKEPHQLGRTDKNGYVAFVPDRPGIWKLQIWGESSHGYHGVTTEIKVDKNLGLESFSRPLVATYTKFVTGISIIIGLFGLYALWLSRRRKSERDNGSQ